MSTSQPHWLSGEDVTTIANHRPASDGRVGTEKPPGPYGAGRRRASETPGALVFLAAIWLLVSSFPLYYRNTGRYDAFWNDLVIGLAVAVVFLVRVVRPADTRSLAWVTATMGGWLMVAPYVLGYGATDSASLAVWNDLAVGLVVLVLSLAGLAMTASSAQKPTGSANPLR
jgi:hypothetical protein